MCLSLAMKNTINLIRIMLITETVGKVELWRIKS